MTFVVRAWSQLFIGTNVDKVLTLAIGVPMLTSLVVDFLGRSLFHCKRG